MRIQLPLSAEAEKDKATQHERRNLVSSFFITILIGLAFQESVVPVRDSIRQSGVTIETAIIFVVFFFTCVRFFIGNQLHLNSQALARMRGKVWFFDLFFITIQSVILVFMGGATSLEVNLIARIKFFDLLFALYAVDVFWILMQYVLGRTRESWRRQSIPWVWAILNSASIFLIFVLSLGTDTLYSQSSLVLLGLFSFVAFVVDILLMDQYDIL